MVSGNLVEKSWCAYAADHVCLIGKAHCEDCWYKAKYEMMEKKVIAQHLHRLDTMTEAQERKEREEVLKATGKDKEIKDD